MGLGFGVWCLGSRVYGLGFSNLEFRVWGLGFRVQGGGFGVESLRFGASGSGFRV